MRMQWVCAGVVLWHEPGEARLVMLTERLESRLRAALRLSNEQSDVMVKRSESLERRVLFVIFRRAVRFNAVLQWNKVVQKGWPATACSRILDRFEMGRYLWNFLIESRFPLNN